jgi:diacylglycerol O-acyltransferase / trehalose O-mycolyltransferase
MRTMRAVAVLAAVLVPLAFAVPAGPARASTYPGSAADGAYVSAENQVNATTLDITISSPDAGASVQVELLLPTGWSPTATQTWPVLYLLHGCCDPYQGWNEDTNVAEETEGAPVIVALPDGGPVGLYTSWYNNGDYGEAYGDFVATELPQILASGFHASGKAAIGGVSTGGGAALVIAADHPGQYAAVASYSGMDCLLLPTSVALIESAILRAGYNPDAPWGSPIAQESIWADNDPCSLASSLSGTQIFLSVGSGITSSGSTESCDGDGNILESVVAPAVYTFAFMLSLNGIPYTSDFYSGGCHSGPYWQTAFDQSWPMLESALGA